ncbi:DUF3080 family protein [Halomonas sp. TRM85114]|nr:DUF3080 family protein [Halomonas jincaotanensis]
MPGSHAAKAFQHDWLKKPLGVLLLLILNGCSGSGESDALLVDYQHQLAELLELEPPTPQPSSNIGAFPDRDQRLFEIPETRDGLLNIFALRECHITNLVAQRNNQLGRVAPASQRWLYELTLWRRLDACWNSEVPQTLAEVDRERLARLTETKTEQLPRASWNALFGSDEWVKNFSRASSVLMPGEVEPPPAQLDALAYLREATLHQFDPDWHPDSSTLEGHLKALQSRPFTAELLRTLLLAEQRLKEASALIENAVTQQAVCSRLEAFTPALAQRQETQQLAAWLERLETAGTTWLGAIDALLEAHIEAPDAVRAYRRRWLSLETAEAPFPAFTAAKERHQALRLSLAERCRGHMGLNLQGESVLLVVQH